MSANLSNRWIGVAAMDWDSVAMAAVYPEDVPSDWRLTWYANYVMAVVLPPERWMSASNEEIQNWLSQVQDNFWFYLFCETSEQRSRLAPVCASFAEKLGGVVMSPSVEAIEGVACLHVGQSALWYDAPSLRVGKGQIQAWLSSLSDDHGLIVVAPDCPQNIRDIQTLLPLLGVSG